jgi:hypothetical protein
MKTYKVYLNIYDFLSLNRCLEPIGLGAYHTGIEIGYLFPNAATPSTVTLCVRRTPRTRASWRCSQRARITFLTERCFWGR